MRKIRILTGFVLLWVLLCSSSLASSVFQPSSEADADRKALALFCRCAFHPEYGPEEEHLLTRWDQEITVWAGGSPTSEDLRTVDSFLAELREKVAGLPEIRRVRQDSQADIRIWYVPLYMMGYYLDGYVEGNRGFFTFTHPGNRIVSARIAIATDDTSQEERNHLLLEELTGALGLPGDHMVYRDSILYDPWTVTQSLSEVDWRMLNILYSPVLSPGMSEDQAREMIKAEMGI